MKRNDGFGPEIQRYLDGDGAAEVPADALKMRVHRARDALKVQLEDRL